MHVTDLQNVDSKIRIQPNQPKTTQPPKNQANEPKTSQTTQNRIQTDQNTHKP